ncbi:putative cysteine peptidase Clan CA family C2 [Trypanosoma vivax]|nr:putative cysteine peptidase Clan CA family C2 [Trypanosoma vivax]
MSSHGGWEELSEERGVGMTNSQVVEGAVGQDGEAYPTATPVEETAADAAPADDVPAEESAGQDGEAYPTEAPVEETAADDAPADDVPAEEPADQNGEGYPTEAPAGETLTGDATYPVETEVVGTPIAAVGVDDEKPPEADRSLTGDRQEHEVDAVRLRDLNGHTVPSTHEWSATTREKGDEMDARAEDVILRKGEGLNEDNGGDADAPIPPQDINSLFKPRALPYKQPYRWDNISYPQLEDSNDEFEIGTALCPRFDESGEETTFKNGEPDYVGEYLSCFDEPNMLYRVFNREEKTWAFYNDTCSYEMHVRFTFSKPSTIEALGNTRLHVQENGDCVAEVVVYPRETEMFVKGNANGFTSKLRAIPLSDTYYLRRQELSAMDIQREIDQIKSIVGNATDSETVLRACVENGIPFVDLEFPPCQASLETEAKKPFKHLPWARPSSYLPDYMVDQVRLFRTPIQPSNVDHGELGDSWVMCSISTITENPSRLINMFRHPRDPELGKKERAVGGYRVTLNKNGIWRSVIVDSYLPISGGRPKYAKSKTDAAEIWPCILEKAFAKLHGSYAAICSGDPLHALQDMTGYPAYRFDDAFANAPRTGRDDLFQDWVNYAKLNYQLLLSTPGKDPKDKNTGDSKLAKRYKAVGLLTGQAYTILDAKFFPEYDLRLLKVRNAWEANANWNGDWCAEDEKWDSYPDVAQACDHRKEETSAFWLTWEACLHYFNGGGVCLNLPAANDYRLRSKFVDCTPSCILEINTEQPTWMSLTISQVDKRGRPGVLEYDPVMISIAHPIDGGLYKVQHNSSADPCHPLSDKWTFYQARDISILFRFLPEKSPYLVVPRLMKLDGQPQEVPYTLSITCNKAIGKDGVNVRFKAIDRDNRVLLNFPKFEPDRGDVELTYQAKENGALFPEERSGTAIC